MTQIKVAAVEMGGKQPDFDCIFYLEMVRPADGFEIEYQFKSGVKIDVEDYKLNNWVR